MADTDLWPIIHSERKALAEDLGAISEEQWALPTPCGGWSVRDVVAHMTTTARVGPATFFPRLAASGFSLSRMQDRGRVTERGASPADALARFASVVGSRRPPGAVVTTLGETLVHAEDVRRGIGRRRAYPMDAVVRVADLYKGSNVATGAKRRIAGLCLRATDTTWRHGRGPEVTGPMMALLLAMSGRQVALAELRGDGVEELRRRG